MVSLLKHFHSLQYIIIGFQVKPKPNSAENATVHLPYFYGIVHSASFSFNKILQKSKAKDHPRTVQFSKYFHLLPTCNFQVRPTNLTQNIPVLSFAYMVPYISYPTALSIFQNASRLISQPIDDQMIIDQYWALYISFMSNASHQ